MESLAIIQIRNTIDVLFLFSRRIIQIDVLARALSAPHLVLPVKTLITLQNKQTLRNDKRDKG